MHTTSHIHNTHTHKQVVGTAEVVMLWLPLFLILSSVTAHHTCQALPYALLPHEVQCTG